MDRSGYTRSIIGALIGILIVLIIAYAYTLSQVRIENVSVERVDNVNLRGLTLNGSIQVHNGGIMQLYIDHADYHVILVATGEEIGNGTLQGRRMPARETTALPITADIAWVPTANTALALLGPGNTSVRIKGTVYIVQIGSHMIKVPFEQEIDIKGYVQQFVRQNLGNAIGDAIDAVKNFFK